MNFVKSMAKQFRYQDTQMHFNQKVGLCTKFFQFIRVRAHSKIFSDILDPLWYTLETGLRAQKKIPIPLLSQHSDFLQ